MDREVTAAAPHRSEDPTPSTQITREPRLSDKVADTMLETILSQELQVGDRLPSERELGEQFGVSRTVVREAVRALVAKGVIEVRSGSGLRVAAVNAAAVTPIRRLDHVAILVRSTDEALRFYEAHLGLSVHSSEELDSPHVRLTYLNTGNAFLQLVEPLDAGSPLAASLETHGEGLHHICFGVDDVAEAVTAISDPGSPVSLGNGRGRVASFVTAADSHGVRIECTEFDQAEDADASRGWLDGRTSSLPAPGRHGRRSTQSVLPRG